MFFDGAIETVTRGLQNAQGGLSHHLGHGSKPKRQARTTASGSRAKRAAARRLDRAVDNWSSHQQHSHGSRARGVALPLVAAADDALPQPARARASTATAAPALLRRPPGTPPRLLGRPARALSAAAAPSLPRRPSDFSPQSVLGSRPGDGARPGEEPPDNATLRQSRPTSLVAAETARKDKARSRWGKAISRMCDRELRERLAAEAKQARRDQLAAEQAILDQLNLGGSDMPQLEAAMGKHIHFWRMRNCVLNYGAEEVQELLLDAEEYYSNSDPDRQLAPLILFDERGVNTIDPVFGWNIAMHCTVLGRFDTLQKVINLCIAKEQEDDATDPSCQSDEMDQTSSKNRKNKKSSWGTSPFMLDLGHKSFTTFDVREVYKEVIGEDANETALREVFQGHENTGYMCSSEAGSKTKNSNSDQAAVHRGANKWRDVSFPRGATVSWIADKFGISEIRDIVTQKLEGAADSKRKGEVLMSLGYIDEAAAAFSECMRKENSFADAACSIMLLYLNQRELSCLNGTQITDAQLADFYENAKAAFDAWKEIDPELLSLGVEKSSLLFMAAVSHAVGTASNDSKSAAKLPDSETSKAEGDVEKSHITISGACEDERSTGALKSFPPNKCRQQELDIVRHLFAKLGPDGSDILDCTLQNRQGRTLRWLLRKVIAEDVKKEQQQQMERENLLSLTAVPDGVQSSVPFFLDIIPSPVETVVLSIWPMYLVLSTIGYYLDISLDTLLMLQYYQQGTDEGTTEPEKALYFWLGCIFYASGVLTTCLFDIITTFVSKSDRTDPNRQRLLAKKCVLNVCQVRMLYECRNAYKAMQKTMQKRMPDGRIETVERTARMPPMSFDQVKCAEGIFEALPQSMLQAFVVISDMHQGRDVTAVQAISLLTSYAGLSVVLGNMGPPDISVLWRVCFMAFVGTNVVLRSFSFSFLLIALMDASTRQELGSWAFRIYLSTSYLVTVFFVLVLQRKAISIDSVIGSIISFMCPVEISQFTVLKTAQPRAAQLPFMIVRYAEIIFLFSWFASLQTHTCLVRQTVHSIDIIRADGTRNVSLWNESPLWANATSNQSTPTNTGCIPDPPLPVTSCHSMEIDPTSSKGGNRWVFYSDDPVYGSLSPLDIAAFPMFPFNVAALLTSLVMLNVILYILCSVMPYKTIDTMPIGLERLYNGTEVQSLTMCLRGSKERYADGDDVRARSKGRKKEDELTRQEKHINAQKFKEQIMKTQLQEYAQKVKEGEAANKLLIELLKLANEEKFELRASAGLAKSASNFAKTKAAKNDDLVAMWWEMPDPEPPPPPPTPDWVFRAQSCFEWKAIHSERWRQIDHTAATMGPQKAALSAGVSHFDIEAGGRQSEPLARAAANLRKTLAQSRSPARQQQRRPQQQQRPPQQQQPPRQPQQPQQQRQRRRRHRGRRVDEVITPPRVRPGLRPVSPGLGGNATRARQAGSARRI